MIKVSIIVPVYNVEKYLRKCLKSIINQSLKEIEIIVVNDGATDGSQEIIDEFVSKYPNIIHSLVKENGGLSDARNFGMPYCKGEYVGFIDSDDYVRSDMYEKMYNKAKEENSDIVVCDYYKSYASKNELIKAKKYINKKDMFIDTLAAAWNKIYRRDLLVQTGVNFPKGLIYEDTEFFCKLVPYINVASYVPEPFVYYVQRNGSIINTQNNKTEQIFQVLDNILDYYRDRKLYDNYQCELEYFYIRILLGSSMERICRIKEKRTRDNLLFKTQEMIYSKFPEWEKNRYLKEIKSYRHLYMKMINKFNIYFYGDLLRRYFIIKDKTLI